MHDKLKKYYPFTDRYFDLDGLALHYLDEGSGEPVVMLHGNPTWSFYYRNLVTALRRPLPLHRPRPYRLRVLRQARGRPLRLYPRPTGG